MPKPDDDVMDFDNMHQVYEYMNITGIKIEEKDLKIIAAGISYRAAWKGIMKYENLHSKSCSRERTLIEFLPNQPLSWKGQIYKSFGLKTPFERHDLLIDRCGKQHRYIVDYYVKDDINFYVDARPAFNGGFGYLDRFILSPIKTSILYYKKLTSPAANNNVKTSDTPFTSSATVNSNAPPN